MKKLEDLSLQEYHKLLKGGMLWEVCPEATGNVNCDLEAVGVSPIYLNTIGDKATTTYFYDILDNDAKYY